MATAFKQTANGAISLVATAPSPATSGTSLVVTAATGTKFPAPGNGFWVTVWNATTYARPDLDPSMEICLATARSTDTLTITRAQLGTAARTVVIGDTIGLLDVDQLFKDFATAINTLEGVTVPKPTYDAVVAASGGDYTTIGAALTAGARNIYVKSGTYSETTAMSTAWTGTKPIYIVGEDRINTVVQFTASTSGYFKVNIAGSSFQNITFKNGNLTLTNHYDGWTVVSASDCTFRDCIFTGQNTTSLKGAALAIQGTSDTIIDHCLFQNASSTGSHIYFDGVTGLKIVNNDFTNSQATQADVHTLNSVNVVGDNNGVLIDGNRWSTASNNQVFALSDGQFHSNTTNKLIFTNNVINYTGTTGTGILYVNNPQSNQNSTFSNNHINTTSTQRVLNLLEADIVVTGNQLRISSTTSSQAVILNNGCDYAVVANNSIYNSATPASTKEGITNSGSTGVTFTGNVIRGYTHATANYGINDSGTNTIFSGNHVRNNTVGIRSVGTTPGYDKPRRYISKTANYTLLDSDDVVLADATSGAITETFPDATLNAGNIFTVTKIDSSGNAVTVGTTSSQNILDTAGDATTKALAAQGNSLTAQSNGTKWIVIAKV